MPTGIASLSTKSKAKEDVSQKIQEIKLRQKNWLKQRDTSKQQDEPNEKPRTSAAAAAQSKPADSKSLSIDHVQNSSTVKKQVVKGPDVNNVRQKFKHWIDTRNLSHFREENTPDFNDYNSVRSGAESELERLVSPDRYSFRQPVSEEEFENLAKKIAHRVKEDLGIHYSNSAASEMLSTALTVEENGSHFWNSSRSRTFTQEAPRFQHIDSPSLSSHNCTICAALMLSSNNIPTMVIPCGHTFCKSCLKGKQVCPSCDCPVLSLTVNIMLQQVIQDYHTSPASSHHKSEFLETAGSSKANTYFRNRSNKDDHGNHQRSYTAQLENLETRHNILFIEHKTLVNNQKQLASRLLQDQKQTQNIEKQEEEVVKAISDLQERLKDLREHRKQYECQIAVLQDDKSKLDGKIALLSTTIISLTKDIEKVKLLSESELKANTG